MKFRDLVYLNEPDHGHIICEAAGGHFNPACDRVISRVKDGDLLGGCVFDHYTGAAISVHVAGFVPNWVNRDLISVVVQYAFVQLGVNKMFGQVNENNAAARAFNESFGFTLEARIKDVFPDGDLLLYSLYRADCKWLGLKPRGMIANRFAMGA